MTTTEADVLLIMDTGLEEVQISPFLQTASTVVTANLASSGLSSSLLDEITKYLAAHLASVRSPFAIRKKIGDADETYGYKGGMGLDATPYGETVKMLDSTGILVSKMSSQMVTFGVVGFALDDTG